LWQRSIKETDEGRFSAATRDLHRILGLGQGAERKAEAQQYLTEIIPARQTEERLFAQAQQASTNGTVDGLQKAAKLLDQVIALNGPRKPTAQTLQETVSSRIQELSNQQKGRQIAALQAEINKDEKAGSFSAAREKLAQLKQLGVDTTTAAAQVDKMEKNAQANAAADQSFNQAVQVYGQATASKDKAGIQTALLQFQQIAQAGGKHAGEAASYITQANKALAALEQPLQPASPTVVTPSSNADQQSIRAALDEFNAAYEHGQLGELKAVWPRAQQKYTDFMRERNGYSFVMVLHPTGAIQITGSNAVVPCDLISTTTTPGGKTQHPTSVKVKLRKSGDRWLIVDPLSSAN